MTVRAVSTLLLQHAGQRRRVHTYPGTRAPSASVNTVEIMSIKSYGLRDCRAGGKRGSKSAKAGKKVAVLARKAGKYEATTYAFLYYRLLPTCDP